MAEEFLARVGAHYNWVGSLLCLAGIIVLTKLGKYLVFRVPALAETRRINREQDRVKLAMDKYPPIVKSNQTVGLYCNIAFFAAILPFCVTLSPQPWWLIPLHAVAVLLFYDFFYYLMHRFWFHGKGRMRQVHALHHQARKPTYIDAHYVHPTETFLGLALFFASIAVMAFIAGPFHVATIVVLYVAYVQLNQINHTSIDLPYFPFRLLTRITENHHRHHENMQMGNYASVVLLYDRLFGTYEQSTEGLPR
jgi:sterol desaturase/sphingolipid hydroxylase (fatty acid hydroxylase superfamily)